MKKIPIKLHENPLVQCLGRTQDKHMGFENHGMVDIGPMVGFVWKLVGVFFLGMKLTEKRGTTATICSKWMFSWKPLLHASLWLILGDGSCRLHVLDTHSKHVCFPDFPYVCSICLNSLKYNWRCMGQGAGCTAFWFDWPSREVTRPDRSKGPITLTFCGQQTTLRPWDPSTCGGISRWVVFFGWFFSGFFRRAGKERSSDFIMWNKILSISVEIRDFRSEDEELFLYTYIPPRRADSETLHVGAVQCQLGEMNGATTGLPTTVWK